MLCTLLASHRQVLRFVAVFRNFVQIIIFCPTMNNDDLFLFFKWQTLLFSVLTLLR